MEYPQEVKNLDSEPMLGKPQDTKIQDTIHSLTQYYNYQAQEDIQLIIDKSTPLRYFLRIHHHYYLSYNHNQKKKLVLLMISLGGHCIFLVMYWKMIWLRALGMLGVSWMIGGLLMLLVDAGTLFDDQQQQFGKQRVYCLICQHYRRSTTHHCQKCNRCITQFHHHSRLFGKCVGSRNKWIYRVWWMLLLLMAITLLLGYNTTLGII